MATPFFNKKEDPFQQRSVNPNAAALAAAQAAAPAPAAAVPSQPAPLSKEAESKLTVGPNIKLKGVEITDCDTLVVEGSVEATMDSRVIQISERGSFKGSAEIDIAEIRGEFDGTLTVRQKLVIYSTGKVTGKIRYGKVVIEEGGQLSGEIEFGTAQARLPITTVRPGLQVHSTAV
jgi:cytoskeletal protein CcmA (bactofilin family)